MAGVVEPFLSRISCCLFDNSSQLTTPVTMQQAIQLSSADSKVLAQVFDPESGPAKPEILVDPSLPPDRQIDAALLPALKAREKEAISHIEAFESSQQKTPAEKESVFRKALAILDGLLAEHPQYASAHNNRAQLRRWRFGDRNLLCQAKTGAVAERYEAAGACIADLSKAISLASSPRPTDAVSPSQGRVLGQAHTQLAAIHYAASKDLNELAEPTVIEKDCCTWSADRFEEEASRLFFLGGLYGNEVAKALAVHTNPHAKLCSSIVKEAMKKELELAQL